MNSQEFEDAAKLLVMQKLIRDYGKNTTINDIQMVWFAHVLGNKKAILIRDNPDDQFIFEVTYNANKQEFYIDAYDKIENVAIQEYAVDIIKRIYYKEAFKKML